MCLMYGELLEECIIGWATRMVLVWKRADDSTTVGLFCAEWGEEEV